MSQDIHTAWTLGGEPLSTNVPVKEYVPHNRLTNVDAMRGIASLAVAWFHFTCGNAAFLKPGILKYSGTYGWAGVEMFFVISGFIIPYTLFRAGYRFRAFFRFVGKRLVRLDPPYLVAIAIIIVLGFLSSHVPGFGGARFEVSWRQLALHLGYVNAFVGEPWLNPVFWTLAIEFQYYLLIGAVFPLLIAKSPLVRAITFTGLGATSFLGVSDRLIVHYIPVFLLGICIFYDRAGLMSRRYVLPIVAGLTVAVWARLGIVIALVSCLAVALLVLDRIPYPRWLIAAGSVSYSLYLLHVPIGGRVINLSMRLPDVLAVKLAALFLAVSVSIAAAYALYVAIEKPAQRWSSRMPLKKDDTEGVLKDVAAAGTT